MAKAKQNYQADIEEVDAFMRELEIPLKNEAAALRAIIKQESSLSERIKWAAPSYYLNNADLLTFNLRNPKCVLLVFHNIAIVNVQSPLLEGNYKDRRLAYFYNMEDIETHSTELKRILAEYINLVKSSEA